MSDWLFVLVLVGPIVLLLVVDGWTQAREWKKAYGDAPFYDDSLGG